MPEPPTLAPNPSGHDEGQRILAVVARNSAFVLGVQVLLKILAFLFNVYVVRRLGAAHFGEYSAVMAYVAIFSIFTDLGMATYSVRAIAEDRERTAWLLPNMVAIRMILSFVVIGVAPLSAYLLGKEHGLVWGHYGGQCRAVDLCRAGPPIQCIHRLRAPRSRFHEHYGQPAHLLGAGRGAVVAWYGLYRPHRGLPQRRGRGGHHAGPHPASTLSRRPTHHLPETLARHSQGRHTFWRQRFLLYHHAALRHGVHDPDFE